MTTRDPKYTSPDDEVFHMTFPQYPDPSVSKKPVNVTITTANTTGDYPLTADHIEAICELDQWRALGRALLEDREDEIAWEWLQDMLARK